MWRVISSSVRHHHGACGRAFTVLITERLGDDITVIDICSEAGVVNRSISTCVIVFLDGRGFVVARSRNSKVIGAKMVNRYSLTSDGEEAIMARSSTFPRLFVASVTFCLRSALTFQVAKSTSVRVVVVAVSDVEVAEDDDI